jgi:hypothetical protein
MCLSSGIVKRVIKALDKFLSDNHTEHLTRASILIILKEAEHG